MFVLYRLDYNYKCKSQKYFPTDAKQIHGADSKICKLNHIWPVMFWMFICVVVFVGHCCFMTDSRPTRSLSTS